MTKSKALKIIQELIEKYGSDRVLYKICDEYKFQLRTTEDDIHKTGLRRFREDYIRVYYTLSSLLTDIQDCESLSGKAAISTTSMNSIGQYVRQCDSNIEWFKCQPVVLGSFEDSKKEYDEFVSDETNAKLIKKHHEKMRRLFGNMVIAGSALTQGISPKLYV